MTKLELAVNAMRASSWTAMNVLGKSGDWTSFDEVEHMKTCPLTERYQHLTDAVGEFLAEWYATTKYFKEQLFEAAQKLENERKQ